MDKEDLKICVLTSDNYLWALRPFSFLFNIFWSDRIRVNIFGFREPDFFLPVNFSFVSLRSEQYDHNSWSSGLLDMLDIIKVDHFILMLEDYWLYESVDSKDVADLYDYMVDHPDVLRMDLSSERNSKRHVKVVDSYQGIQIVEAPPRTSYMMSFQAGIWNTNLMREIIVSHESPWDAEIRGTFRLWERPDMKVLGTRRQPLKYTPAVRRHKNGMNIKRISRKLVSVMRRRGWLEGHHVPIHERLKV